MFPTKGGLKEMSSKSGRKMFVNHVHDVVFCISEQSRTPKTAHYPTCGIILWASFPDSNRYFWSGKLLDHLRCWENRIA